MTSTYTYDVDQFRDVFEHDFTWINGFLRNVRRFGNSTALRDPYSGRQWTYRELNEDSNRLAHALISDGLGKQDVLMFMLLNSPEFVLAYLASHKCGSIACPINFRLSAGEIAHQLEDSKPKVFIYGADFSETVRRALQMSNWKPDVIIVVDGCGSIADGETDFTRYLADRPISNPTLDWRPHIYDETLRLYTSGTTNKAKAVPINSINEVLSAHDVIMHFPLAPTDRTMNMTPWFHRGGIHSGGPAPTLYVGGEIVILREFNPRKCLQLAEKEKVTYLVGVPALLALLARAQEHSPVDLSHLRGIVTMGSPFDKSACMRYMELFTPNIFNGYGTTETFWNTFLRPWNLPELAGSTGQSCTDDDVRIVRLGPEGTFTDPDDLVKKDNAEIGEIIIRSPAKSTGCYVNNAELDALKFHSGYHYTGDLGIWDENEVITVVSRKDDMIISAGENIYPTQIEAILNENPKVAEAAVVGRPDKRHGQHIVAFVVPADPGLTVEELRTYCLEHAMLPSFKRPKFFYMVDSLPHTATGKLMHYKIREMAEKMEEK